MNIFKQKWFQKLFGLATPKPVHRYTYPIPSSQGRRFVIPDIHGCNATFKELLLKIALTPQDQLFLLGDYIDRGIDSVGVLNTIMELQTKGLQVFLLRGNHEEMLLEVVDVYPERLEAYIKTEKMEGLFDEAKKIKPDYDSFIRNLPFYFELKDYYLVHAGFNFGSQHPFEDYNAMLWIRDFDTSATLTNNKKIIHGHSPYSLSIIKECIAVKAMIIPLDNGCVFHGQHEDLGNLLCLNLDTFELIVQKNIEAFK